MGDEATVDLAQPLSTICLSPTGPHLIAGQPATLCPLVEFLIKSNTVNQCFWKQPLVPQEGMVTVPDRPRMGVEIDDNKVVAETALP